MKTKIIIELEIEAPDWTGFTGDTQHLLRLISNSLELFPTRSDHYEWSNEGKEIKGAVSLSPAYESKGTYTITPEHCNLSPVIEEKDDYILYKQAGYSVKENGFGWAAINPLGFSIIRGFTRTEEEAWNVVVRDYHRTKDNVD